MQTMFGFGFKEHGQGFSAMLPGRENFGRATFIAYRKRRQPALARRPARLPGGPGPLDPQPFHGPEFITRTPSGNEAVAAQHASEGFVRPGHSIASGQRNRAPNHEGS